MNNKFAVISFYYILFAAVYRLSIDILHDNPGYQYTLHSKFHQNLSARLVVKT